MIYKVITYFKFCNNAYDYYKNYKVNKKYCGRRNTLFTLREQDFVQALLELN